MLGGDASVDKNNVQVKGRHEAPYDCVKSEKIMFSRLLECMRFQVVIVQGVIIVLAHGSIKLTVNGTILVIVGQVYIVALIQNV